MIVKVYQWRYVEECYDVKRIYLIIWFFFTFLSKLTKIIINVHVFIYKDIELAEQMNVIANDVLPTVNDSNNESPKPLIEDIKIERTKNS